MLSLTVRQQAQKLRYYAPFALYPRDSQKKQHLGAILLTVR